MSKTRRSKKQKPVVLHPQETMVISQAALNALSLGYDFEHRTIYIFGGIDQMAAYRFVTGFKWMDRFQGAIHIILNSGGGSVEDSFAMYDTIRTAENPVIVEGLGMIASAAVPILQAGTIRILNPEATVMIHDVSYDIEGRLSSPVVGALAKEAQEINQRYYEILANRSGQSIKDVKEWCREETSFGATEAVEKGFADEVLPVRVLPRTANEAMREIQGLTNPERLPVEKTEKRIKGKK